MLKKLLFILITLLLVLAGVLFIKEPYVSRKGLSMPPIPTPFPAPEIITEDEMWNTVQKWRISTNRKEYIKNETLCKMASIRLEETKTNWSHQGFKKAASNIARNFTFVGENLAVRFKSEATVLYSWINSPSHRENLEDKNFQYSCIKTDGNNIVHIFGGY